MRNQVLTDYCNLSDINLSQLAFIVAHSIADNYYFPNPVPTLDTLISQTLAFNEAIKQAKDNSKTIPAKEKLRNELLSALHTLAHYVNEVSGGKKAILLTSGFTLSEELFVNNEKIGASNFSRIKVKFINLSTASPYNIV